MKKNQTDLQDGGLSRKAEQGNVKKSGKLSSPAGVEKARLVRKPTARQVGLEMQYEFAPVGHFVLTKNSTIEKVNMSGAMLLGMERSLLAGQQLGLYMTDEFRPIFKAFLKKTFASAQKETCDVIFLNKQQDRMWAHLEAIYINGQCWLVMVDITERKHAEEDSRRLAAIIESSEDAIISKSLDGIVISWNMGAEKIYGYTAAEMIGQSISILIPPDLQYALSFVINSIKKGESIKHFETIRVRKDGRHIDISLSMAPIRNDHGEIAAISIIAREITERKLAEKALQESNEIAQAVLNASAESVFLMKVDGTILAANHTVAVRMNTTMKELIGANIYKLAPGNVAEYRRKRVAGVVSTKKTAVFEDEQFGVWVENSVYPIISSDGEVRRIAVYGRDITERKHFEEILSTQSKQLSLLYEASQRLNQTLNLQEIYDSVADFMSTVAPNDELVVSSFDAETGLITCRAFMMNHKWEDVSNFPPIPLEPEGQGTQSIAIRTGEPLLFNDYQAQMRTAQTSYYFNDISHEITRAQVDTPEGGVIQSAMIVPLKVGDRVSGVIQVLSFKQNAYNENQLKLLEALALHIAAAEKNALLYLQVQSELHERRQTELALRASEKKYRTLLEQLPIVVYINPADDLSYTTYTSPQIKTLLGYSSHEWIADPELWKNSLHPEDRLRVLAEADHATVSGEKLDVEYRLIAQSGEVVWVHDTLILVHDDDGGPSFWQGFMVDITERKQAEEAQLRLEKANQSLIKNLHAGIVIHAPDTQIVFNNEQASKLLGLNNDELSGKKVVDPAWHFLREDVSVMPVEEYPVAQVVDRLIPVQNLIVGVNRPAKQDIVWALVNAFPEFDTNGELLQVVVTFVDITERKNAEDRLLVSEQRYRLLFESIPISIWEEDYSQAWKYLEALKGQGVKDFRSYFSMHPQAVVQCSALVRVLNVNDAALAMYHAQTKEKLIESADGEMSDGEFELMREILIAMAYGNSSLVYEGTNEILTGEIIEIGMNWAVVPGYEKDYSKVIVTTVDITERKQADQKLKASKIFFQESLDALSSHIAILDNDGTITAVNKKWRQFGQENGLAAPNDGVGLNYLEICEASAGQPDGENATAIGEAIKELLANENADVRKEFEYPCNSPQEKRWFIARLARFEEQGQPRLVVSHENITARKQVELNNERRVVELEALYQSGIAFNQTLDRRDIGEKIIEVVSGSLDWHHAAVRVRRGDSEFVDLLAFIHSNEHADGDFRMQSAVNKVGEGLSGWVIEHGKPIRINNLADDPRYINTFDGMKSGLYVPMRIGDKTIGCISAESEELNSFNDEDERLLSTLATQAAVSIQKAELFEETQKELARRMEAEEKSLRQLERLTALQEINQAITSTVDLQVSLNILLSRALQILVVDAISILLLNSETQTLDYTASFGFRTKLKEGVHLKLGEEYAGKVAQDQHLFYIPDLSQEAENLFLKGVLSGEGFVGYVGIPLIVKGKILGVLEVFKRSVMQADAEWFKFFGTLAEQASISIDNANLFLISQHELAERKQVELALRQSYQVLEQRVEERTADLKRLNLDLEYAMRTKDEFLANMSHELRTPLNAIIGLSESLTEQVAGSLNEKQQRYIQTIGESGHHLLVLINDILDLAKIESGHMELEINLIQVQSLCESSVRMVRELAQKKSQTLSLKIDPIVQNIYGDERRLKQSLVNLLSNAVKFTPDGRSIGLDVQAHPLESRIAFTIWDNGIGIAPEQMPLLFQSFVQLNGGLAREHGGTGLGLVLVKQMIEMHGGTVYVESEVDKGSRFTISIPWAAESIPLSEKKKTGPLSPSLQIEERSGESILLVDDTEEIILLMNDYLTHKGYTVFTARNGMEALSIAVREHPHLILMDVMMPGMDGLEATRRIRMDATLKDTPIIGLTSLAMPGDQEKCIEAGMNDYLSKPIELKQLIGLIKFYLSDSRNRAL